MKTVNTSNIYLSSETGVKGSGTDFEVYLPAHGFTVKDGQFMRLTVQSMLGGKRFTDVNEYNSKFYASVYDSQGDGSYSAPVLCELSHTNHRNLESLGLDFGEVLVAKLNEADVTLGATLFSNNTEINTGTTKYDSKISVTITLPQYKKVLVTFVRDLTLNEMWDTHLLLGGKANGQTQSMNISDPVEVGGGGGVFHQTITSHFPAQTHTINHVYLRSSLVTDSHQNHHFDSSNYSHDGHIIGSTIMCKAAVHPGYFSFDDMNSKDTGYSINIGNRSLTYINFKLTTDKDQPLPNADAHFVELVLRLDILQEE